MVESQQPDAHAFYPCNGIPNPFRAGLYQVGAADDGPDGLAEPFPDRVQYIEDSGMAASHNHG